MKEGWTSTLSTGDLLCGETSFDGDPDYGHDKQCFCETDPSYEEKPPAERCADKEKDDCVCSGVVYYGQKICPFDDVPLDFAEMKDYSFITREVEGSIQCSNKEFGDPIKGKEKQCFCEQNN